MKIINNRTNQNRLKKGRLLYRIKKFKDAKRAIKSVFIANVVIILLILIYYLVNRSWFYFVNNTPNNIKMLNLNVIILLVLDIFIFIPFNVIIHLIIICPFCRKQFHRSALGGAWYFNKECMHCGRRVE